MTDLMSQSLLWECYIMSQQHFLSQRTQPKEEESLYSFLYNVAINNGYDHSASMLKEISRQLYACNCNYIDPKQGWTRSIFEIMNLIDPDLIDKLTLNQYNNVLFGGDPDKAQKDQNFNQYHVKFCPACLKEDFYHRLLWDVSYITVCHKHKTSLVDHCPKCDHPIQLSRFMRNECLCGHSLTETRLKKCKDSNRLKVQKEFIDLLTGEKETITIENGIKLNRREYFELFEHFGYFIHDFPGSLFDDTTRIKEVNFSFRSNQKRGITMLDFIVTQIHRLIVNPSEIFPELLPYFYNVYKEESKENYYRKGRKLRKILSHSKGKVYRGIYEEYFKNLKEKHSIKRSLINVNDIDKNFVSFREAQKIVGVDMPSFKLLCQIGAIRTYPSDEKKGDVVVEKKSAVKFKKLKSQCINLHLATDELEASVDVVKKLIKGGLLKAEHGPEVDGYVSWLIKKKKFEQFRDSLFKKSTSIHFISEDDMSFHETVFKLRSRMDAAEIIKKIISGEFRSRIMNERRSLKGMYILRKDVEKFCFDEEKRRIDRLGFRKKILSKILGMGAPKIDALIDSGKLRVNKKVRNDNGMFSYYISKEQIESFLMKKHNLDPETVWQHIDKKLESIVLNK